MPDEISSATTLTQRFQDAFIYATTLHASQMRKGTGIPYISHLLSVSAIVLEFGGNEDEAIAGLLHDAIEDQGQDGATRAEIYRRFGERVGRIVDGCTDADQLPKPPWRQRKEAYIAHLRQCSPSIRLVSAADKLHNARSILSDYRVLGDALWERFNSTKEDNRWYYRSVVQALTAAGPNPIVEELRRVVAAMERLMDDFGSRQTSGG